VGNSETERILAQAKVFRLDESVSRPDESSSPRRDLAQLQGWISDIFAQVRAARLGEINRIPIYFHMQSHAIHTRNLIFIQQLIQASVKHRIMQI